MTQADTPTIGPKCHTNRRDDGSDRCAASNHPIKLNDSYMFTASFRIYSGLVGIVSGRCITECYGIDLSTFGRR